VSQLSLLLAANDRYAYWFTKGDLSNVPRRGVVILTCMDARFDPAKALGLEEGDAHVLRNAGGRATDDAIRSLVLSSYLLGTREFLVIHHTDCGLQAYTEEEIRERLRQQVGVNASDIEFLTFTDLDESVRQDVATIRASPLMLNDISVRGFVYDVRNGRLRDVE